MITRETCDTNLDEQDRRNFVLKQPSRVGPWLALGLGISVLAFVGSLLYLNLTRPPLTAHASEKTLQPETNAAPPVLRNKRATQRALERRRPAMTTVIQGRAPNALLGGHGPALPPEYAPRSTAAPAARGTAPAPASR